MSAPVWSFVFAGEVFFGGEEDLGAVGGHAVEEDAFGGAGGEFDRFAGVADVHVEVPVAGRPCFFGELAEEDVGAVGGDGELADRRPRRSWVQAGDVRRRRGAWRRAWVSSVFRLRS